MKAVIRHCITLYDALKEASSEETIDEETYLIYRGQISKLYSSTGIGASYYTEIFDQLDRQGCITYLQRGSKNVDTVIMLHFAPSEGGWQDRPGQDLTSAEKFANLIETVQKNDILLGGINIAEALKVLQERIERLERIHRGVESSEVHSKTQHTQTQ